FVEAAVFVGHNLKKSSRNLNARGKGDYLIDFEPAPRITEADKTND
ncbi:hypothetical protein Tco_1205416, partial [Tanacetum coccineum]